MFNENTAEHKERSSRLLSHNLFQFAFGSVSLTLLVYFSIDPAILRDFFPNLKSQSTTMLYIEFGTGFVLGSVVT
jgi:hypothetical protein